MTPAPWRHARASVIGTSHLRAGLTCQDASVCRLLTPATGPSVLVALVADGAGSACRAEVGAELACRFLADEITARLAAGAPPSSLTRDTVLGLLRELQGRIGERAEEEGLTPRDFASTLIGAVVGDTEAVFFQVGDGAIVVSTPEDPEGYSWVFWPASGEYENTTFFWTDPEVERWLEWDLAPGPIDQLALFSDGLQRLALHYQSRTAHAPFFRSKLAVLEAAPDPEALSAPLARFLGSREVNERTDDDKTLILATRRPPPSPPSPFHASDTADPGLDDLR